MLSHKIHKLAQAITPEVVGFRRHLHQHPELSFEEYKTSAFVQDKLKALDIPFQAGIASTGVVGFIQGKKPGPVVALRADMDALPITESNTTSYVSQNPGIMHACGHDAHTASLLGAAAILQDCREEMAGSIKLIFQPGEERLPGGASLMIAEGVLENPQPAHIIGQHVMPFLDAGTVGFRKGMYMASADEITMTVTGKGGHAAQPHQNIDTVLITSHIIVALQQLVSRFANPTIPSVLSFGKITAAGAFNIIPNQVEVLGTFRTMNEAWRSEAHVRMKEMAEGIAKAMGGQVNFFINKGYPFLVNDVALTTQAEALAVDYLGRDKVVELDLWMAAEDFAYYSQQTKACFYRLGTRNTAKGIVSAVHTPTFDIDESALEIGCGLMAYLAIESLNEKA